MKPWQHKYQRHIAQRVGYTTNAEWARALCRIVIWYGEKYPDADCDVEAAQKALDNMNQCYGDIVIRRDKSGFTMRYAMGNCSVTVDNRGLPPVPTTYETL